MLANPKKLLYTRPIEEDLQQQALQSNIQLHCLPFTEIKLCTDEPTKQKLAELISQRKDIIITSMNAVRALNLLLQSSRPDWRIHCIGPVTATALAKLFGEEKIISVSSYGEALASQLIEKYKEKDFVFFCGNRRLDTLPETLAKARIKVEEIILYNNISLSHKISHDYDAAVFFSPSAVEAFFQSNPNTAVNRFFSIGKTTSAKIAGFRQAEIIEPEETSEKSMLDRIISYYSTFA